jgi:hypothetical protein
MIQVPGDALEEWYQSSTNDTVHYIRGSRFLFFIFLFFIFNLSQLNWYLQKNSKVEVAVNNQLLSFLLL